MKKYLCLLTVLLLIAALASGCQFSQQSQQSSSGQAPSSQSSQTSGDNGYFDGRVGDRMATYFFDFTVQSVDFVEQYGEYAAQEGNILIDAVVKVKNIFGEELPMFNSDFQIQWGDGDDDFGYGVEALEGSEGVMPQEFPLKRGESVEYHVVYEVPEDSTEYSISYLELFDDDTEGDVFFIYFER